MSFFSKNKFKEDSVPERKEIGLVIHITPIAIYLYISESGTVSSYMNGSGLSMEDIAGNYVEIHGNYISLKLHDESEIENVMNKYGLNDANLPIIKFRVNSQ